MASPPPGGSPPPQQPYPPQYPPQQPYYPQPMAPPPKKSNTALIIVIVVVVIVVALAAVAWYAFSLMTRPVSGTYSVTGVSFTITYPGTNAFFGTSPMTTCGNCPVQVGVAAPGAVTITLTNRDTVNHNVTAIAITSFQFYLASASPDPSSASPVVVGPSQSKVFTLMIGATSLSGSGTLTGTIETS